MTPWPPQQHTGRKQVMSICPANLSPAAPLTTTDTRNPPGWGDPMRPSYSWVEFTFWSGGGDAVFPGVPCGVAAVEFDDVVPGAAECAGCYGVPDA
jgi:hypothetical protein